MTAQSAVSTEILKPRLEAFVTRAMTRLAVVPGVSVAVVRGSDVIYRGGFGLANVAEKTPVKSSTVFYTASLAKAVTGLTIASLLAEGRVSLDDPLSKYFIGFVPPTGGDASKATVRGILGHNAGFGNPTINYVTAYVRDYDDAELIRVLNTYSQPLPAFQYANTNYVLAAKIAGAVEGRAWKDAAADRVFRPLRMGSSTFRLSEAKPGARPYRADASGFTPLRQIKTDETLNGAGGFFSTADDLARLVVAYLNHGRVDGRQALPAAAVALASQKTANVDATFGYFKRTGYGIGLYLGEYDGEPFMHHFGSITGFRSHLSFMPSRGVGVVVLQNEGVAGSRLADLVAAYAYDLLAGRDAGALGDARIEEYRSALDKRNATPDPQLSALATARAQPATLGLPLAAYAGTYRSERLGTLTVAARQGRLVVTFGALIGDAIPSGAADVLVDYGGGDPPDPWTFTVAEGRITGFDWGGRIFTRTDSR